MMKKINVLLCSVTASLFFIVSFMSFDYGVFGMLISPYYDAQAKGEFVLIEWGAYTNLYHQSIEVFNQNLKEFYEKIPYDGYVKHRSTTGLKVHKPRTHSTFYLSNKSHHAYSHLSFSHDPSLIDFNDRRKHDYISNDLDDKEATSHILPFNRFRTKVRDDLAKDRIIYRSIHDLDLSQFTNDNDTYVAVFFLVPRMEVDSFKDYLKEEFIKPNYDCNKDEVFFDIKFCNMSLSSLEHPKYFAQYLVFDLFNNPFQFPQSLVFLTSFSLFLTLLHLSFKESKEISIRRLYGNREFLIFNRVFLKTFVVSLFSFVMTIGVLSALVLDFSLSLTASYIVVLLTIIGCYVVGSMFATLSIFGLLMVASRLAALKKPMNPKLSLMCIGVVKVFAIFTLSIPLLTAYEKMNRSQRFINYVNRYPYEKDGYLVTMINYGLNDQVLSGLNDGHSGLSNEQSANVWLFKMVEKYKGSFVSFYSIINFSDSAYHRNTTPYIIVNRNYLKHDAIYDLNNERVNVDVFQKNTLLVPQGVELKQHDATVFEDADIAYVKATPTIVENTGTYAPIKNPAILVVVDNPSNYVYWINQDSIRLDDNQEVLKGFHHEVSHRISAPVLNKTSDYYDRAIISYQDGLSEFMVMIGSTVVVMMLYALMQLVSFVESRYKLLAIQAIHGLRRARRYEVLMYLVYLSVAAISVCTHMRNHYEQPPLQLHLIWGYSGFILILETLLLVISIRRFEKQSISSILKGDA